jgi:hypothetical protein
MAEPPVAVDRRGDRRFLDDARPRIHVRGPVAAQPVIAGEQLPFVFAVAVAFVLDPLIRALQQVRDVIFANSYQKLWGGPRLHPLWAIGSG